MPYRRLPNTDEARVRALRQAIEKAEASNINDMAISLNTLSNARNFLSQLESAQGYYKQCYANQAKSSKKHQANVKTARMYVSHFIQVLNMAVLRMEIKKKHKEYYGLAPDDFSVPDLTSEASIAEWGEKIIAGERKRVALGGPAIYSPTVAKVKVHYDIFMEGYIMQKGLQQATFRSLEKVSSMRVQADSIILDVWNQVENMFKDVSPNEARLNKCREYGVVYYYRSYEK